MTRYDMITSTKRIEDNKMKYENRGQDIIKIENDIEYIMIAQKVNGMDSFIWEEIKPEVKTLTCVFQPDLERKTFTHLTKYEITRETACFWWIKDNNGYPNRKISKRTMREAGYKEAYASEFDV